MGTSALIKVENGSIQLYKHYDGYPEGTLNWLIEFNTRFSKERSNDIPYKEAQLVRSSVFMRHKYQLDSSETTGWGIYPKDEKVYTDYTYILKEDGTVQAIKG